MLKKKLSEFEPGVEGKFLLEMFSAYEHSLVLYQSYKLGVFDALHGSPQSAELLARETGYLPERLIFLLDALTSMGLLEKTGDEYVNSPVARAFLSRSSSFYLGDLIAMNLSPERIRHWETLDSWLKGKTTGDDSHNPMSVFNPSFVRAMAQGVLCNKGFLETISLVAGHSCFPSAQKLLDLGGGHGLFSIALKRIKPNLEAVVFDLPQVEQVTRDYAKRYAAEIGFHPGNFYEDELPPGQDMILAFDILHPVPPSQKEGVFARVHRALKPGGHLFYKLWFLDATRTNPRRAAIFALSCKLRNKSSHVYTLEEAKEMLGRIGFQVEGAVDAGDMVSTMLVARKER